MNDDDSNDEFIYKKMTLLIFSYCVIHNYTITKKNEINAVINILYTHKRCQQ